MPISVPMNVFPVVVEMLTVLSTNAATSVWYFLNATDNYVSLRSADYDIAFQLFIFDINDNAAAPLI